MKMGNRILVTYDVLVNLVHDFTKRLNGTYHKIQSRRKSP